MSAIHESHTRLSPGYFTPDTEAMTAFERLKETINGNNTDEVPYDEITALLKSRSPQPKGPTVETPVSESPRPSGTRRHSRGGFSEAARTAATPEPRNPGRRP